MRSRIPAIARKEALHIARDWRTLSMAFVLPCLLILLFSYAITFDIKDIKMAVSDCDNTKASRELIEKFSANGYFKLVGAVPNPEQLNFFLDSGQAQMTIYIPNGYAKALERNEEQSVQVIFDGSESNTATIAENYVNTIFAEMNFGFIERALVKNGISAGGIPPINADVRVWFNPELKSTNTIVTGLIGAVMMIVAALLTSLTVVRERETGSLEGLIATPVRKYEILTGKMLPYLGISLIDCLVVTFIGMYLFGVPFHGNLVMFAICALIFSAAGLSMGMLISVFAKNQLFANQLAILSTVLPSIMLSGFMFPIKSMPGWIQVITYLVPARYFITICRGILLKDQPVQDIYGPVMFLVLFTFIFMALSVRLFRKKI